MAKAVGYKGAPTNKNIGGKTHGSFKNSGQKDGKHGAIKSVKEAVKNQGTMEYMKKVLGDMRKQKKALGIRGTSTTPGTGAFH